jgi:hypothetical protein
MKSKLKDGWIWSALIAISFLLMLSAKLFTGWAISWWIVTLPLWIIPALVICIASVCVLLLMGVGVFTILLNVFCLMFGERDDYDD